MAFATGVATLDRQKRHCATSGRSGSHAPQPAGYPDIVLLVIAFLLCTMHAFPAAAQDEMQAPLWHTVDAQGQLRLNAYVFWSKTCPHCEKALRFLHRLKSTHAWLRLHTFELSEQSAHIELYHKMAALSGEKATYVPAFFFCQQMFVGYASDDTTGQLLRDRLLDCYQHLQEPRHAAERREGQPAETPHLAIPLLGEMDPSALSLPVVTFVIAGLDAFNPCAFFVLLFLLSLLIHACNRRRMLVIGGAFVACSGALYFLFMAAWLNLFLIIGQLRLITLAAGAIALVMALINIKDYFWPKRGLSLVMPEGVKPTLYKRMRGLVYATHLPSMLLGTVTLAVMANTYELLCTAGFPMVYTRILTLEDLSVATYYSYLALYNLIYVIPMGLIVLVFTITLGSHKLQEREGQRLKLLSGLMMLNLSLVLLVMPELLNNMLVAIAVLTLAMLTAGLIILVDHRRTHRQVVTDVKP
jgi:glutaredoxin